MLSIISTVTCINICLNLIYCNTLMLLNSFNLSLTHHSSRKFGTVYFHKQTHHSLVSSLASELIIVSQMKFILSDKHLTCYKLNL